MKPMYWLIAFVVLLLIEIITMGLTTIWFAGGALVAFVMGLLGLNPVAQVIAFLAVSVILLILTRPLAVKYFNRGCQKTNADSLIGRQALVLEDVDTLHSSGRVKVNGQEWSAKTEDPAGVIRKDAVVTIEGIQGVKLIVKEKEE